MNSSEPFIAYNEDTKTKNKGQQNKKIKSKRLKGRKRSLPANATKSWVEFIDSRTGDARDDKVTVLTTKGNNESIRSKLHGLLNLPAGVLPTYDFSTWTRSFTKRCLSWMRRYILRACLPNCVVELEQKLQERLLTLLPDKKKSNSKGCNWLKILFTHHCIDELNLGSLKHDTHLRKICPDLAEWERTRVSIRQTAPLACIIQNITKVSMKAECVPLPNAQDCPCQRYIPASKKGEHLYDIADELESISDKLRALFKRGSKYRLHMDKTETRDAIETGVNEYINKMGWVGSEFAKTLQQKIQEKFSKLPNTMESERVSMKELRSLHEDVVIGGVDKAKHNFGAICRPYYLSLLQQELSVNNTFVPWEGDQTTLVDALNGINRNLKLKEGHAIPYLYGIMKRHKGKGVRKLRWIAGTSTHLNKKPSDDPNEAKDTNKRSSPQNCMSSMHQEASGILKTVMSALKNQDRAEEAKTGVRKFFIVESIDDVAAVIKQHENELAKLTPKTFDFSAMYGTIPQDHAIQQLSQAITRAFEYMDNKRLQRPSSNRARKKTFDWSSEEEPKFGLKTYNLKEVINLVSFVVKNSYVKNGECIRKQQKGLPTGGNASPDIANLFCYNIEYNYVSSLNIEEQRKLSTTSRFIDDMLMWGTQPPPAELYGMEYLETSHEEDKVTFLGMMIRIQRYLDSVKPRVRLSVYNKELDWVDFSPLKYTSVYSTAPRKQIRGVLTGAVLRANTICNNLPDFKMECQRVLYHLFSRGHDPGFLTPTWKNVIKRLYSNFPKELSDCMKLFTVVVNRYKAEKPMWPEQEHIGGKVPVPPKKSTAKDAAKESEPLPAMPSLSPSPTRTTKSNEERDDMDLDLEKSPMHPESSRPLESPQGVPASQQETKETEDQQYSTQGDEDYCPMPFLNNVNKKQTKNTSGKAPLNVTARKAGLGPGYHTPQAFKKGNDNRRPDVKSTTDFPPLSKEQTRSNPFPTTRTTKTNRVPNNDDTTNKDHAVPIPDPTPGPDPMTYIREWISTLSIQSSVPRSKQAHPRLDNDGTKNLCYINTMIQMLLPTYLSHLRHLPTPEGDTCSSSIHLLQAFMAMGKEAEHADGIRKLLQFNKGTVEDLHEATVQLLDNLSETWDTWSEFKKDKKSLWDQVEYLRTFTCECGRSSSTITKENMINVSIPDQPRYSFESLMNSEIENTKMFQRDCVNPYCDRRRCREKVVTRIPLNIIVALKKYSYTQDNKAIKKTLKCHIPRSVILNGHTYFLETAGIHQGPSATTGHYRCIRFRGPTGFNTLLDDQYQYAINERCTTELLQKEGYLLVFRREKPKINGTHPPTPNSVPNTPYGSEKEPRGPTDPIPSAQETKTFIAKPPSTVTHKQQAAPKVVTYCASPVKQAPPPSVTPVAKQRGAPPSVAFGCGQQNATPSTKGKSMDLDENVWTKSTLREKQTPMRQTRPPATPMTERHVATPDINMNLFTSPYNEQRPGAPTPMRTGNPELPQYGTSTSFTPTKQPVQQEAWSTTETMPPPPMPPPTKAQTPRVQPNGTMEDEAPPTKGYATRPPPPTTAHTPRMQQSGTMEDEAPPTRVYAPRPPPPPPPPTVPPEERQARTTDVFFTCKNETIKKKAYRWDEIASPEGGRKRKTRENKWTHVPPKGTKAKTPQRKHTALVEQNQKGTNKADQKGTKRKTRATETPSKSSDLFKSRRVDAEKPSDLSKSPQTTQESPTKGTALQEPEEAYESQNPYTKLARKKNKRKEHDSVRASPGHLLKKAKKQEATEEQRTKQKIQAETRPTPNKIPEKTGPIMCQGCERYSTIGDDTIFTEELLKKHQRRCKGWREMMKSPEVSEASGDEAIFEDSESQSDSEPSLDSCETDLTRLTCSLCGKGTTKKGQAFTPSSLKNHKRHCKLWSDAI